MESDSEIGIEAGLEVDDPRVCHLTADRDLEAAGSARPLLQRILGVPEITGIRLHDARTIVVQSPETEHWPATVEQITGLMREHLEPGREDPNGGAPEDSTLAPPIRVQVEVDNLSVCRLTADRELETAGPAKPLLQQVLGVHGITGVTLLDGRTILVQRPEPETWGPALESIKELMREHLDSSQKDPTIVTRLLDRLEQLGQPTISVKFEADDPRVRSLTADRDIGKARPAGTLMKKILGVPGITGVRLSDARTIVVGSPAPENWPAMVEQIEKLMREHLDPRQRGTPGGTWFASIAKKLRERLRQLSRKKIKIQVQDDGPRVRRLTADRDIGTAGPAVTLMQKTLGVTGITGVNLLDGRTLVVESHPTETWRPTVEEITKLIRAHLDPRPSGPRGSTPFGWTLENLWGSYQELERFAVPLKKELEADRHYSLWAFVVTAISGWVGGLKPPWQYVGSGLGFVSGALGTYFTKRSAPGEREQKWARSRALAEEAKSEAIRFLVRCPPYDGEDAALRLKERADRVRDAMLEIGVFEELDAERRLKDLPKYWWSMDDYLRDRVKDQSDWYNRKSKQHLQAAERYKLLVMLFGGLATVCSSGPAVSLAWTQIKPVLAEFLIPIAGAAWSAVAQQWLEWMVGVFNNSTSLMAVATSVAGAVTSHAAQTRQDFIALTYKRTRVKLEALLAEWYDLADSAKQDPNRRNEFINKFEGILNQEHAQWSQEISQGGGGSAPAPVFDPGLSAPVPAAVSLDVAAAPAATPPALEGVD